MVTPVEHVRWRVVNSSNVDSIGWDDDRHMYVKFKSGSIYRYDDVSRQRVVAITRVKSAGKYLHRKVLPQFKAVRIA